MTDFTHTRFCFTADEDGTVAFSAPSINRVRQFIRDRSALHTTVSFSVHQANLERLRAEIHREQLVSPGLDAVAAAKRVASRAPELVFLDRCRVLSDDADADIGCDL